MSIQSMTGFGRSEIEGSSFSLSVELKTVNNRYKDFRFKMGNVFNPLEIKLKKSLEKKFTRGSFEVFINYRKVQQLKDVFEIDETKVQNFIEKISKMVANQNVQLNVQPTEFLRNDFIIEDETKEEELTELLNEIFPKAVDELEKSRQEEGQKLVAKLQDHKKQYSEYFEKVKLQRTDYQVNVKAKLLKRFESFEDLEIDEPRFLQEIIYYLEKLDIDEELNRIDIHLQKLDKLLVSHSEVGRQIDFLVQELNRETNTIGSKSGDQYISENVVQMKVQLEKIREQALNLQ